MLKDKKDRPSGVMTSEIEWFYLYFILFTYGGSGGSGAISEA